jgi:hypothetical protein
MRTRTIGVLFSSLVLSASACNDDADDEPAKPTAARPLIQQVPPPLDLKEPPKDATKTASGLMYTKLVERHAGEPAKRNDTVMVRYTGWRQSTGETFFTMGGGDDALGIDVAYAAPSFGEALQQLRKGEKAVLWVPPGQGTPETLVYEVEVVDINRRPQSQAGCPRRARPASLKPAVYRRRPRPPGSRGRRPARSKPSQQRARRGRRARGKRRARRWSDDRARCCYCSGTRSIATIFLRCQFPTLLTPSELSVLPLIASPDPGESVLPARSTLDALQLLPAGLLAPVDRDALDVQAAGSRIVEVLGAHVLRPRALLTR